MGDPLHNYNTTAARSTARLDGGEKEKAAVEEEEGSGCQQMQPEPPPPTLPKPKAKTAAINPWIFLDPAVFAALVCKMAS